jgi:hypothetical protein
VPATQKPEPDSYAPGPLKGLLFGNPRRFMADLMYQLRMKSAYLDFVTSSRHNVDRETFRAFLVGIQRWQNQHGFQAAWPSIWQGGNWAGLGETLKKLESPSIDKILAETSWLADINNWAITSQQAGGSTSFERGCFALDTAPPRFPELRPLCHRNGNAMLSKNLLQTAFV